MIGLISRWKLRDGCPPELAAAIEELTEAVKRQEPGTLVYSCSLPAPNPPIGPPPEYGVDPSAEIAPVPQNELVFFEVYRDAEAFSAHLRGPIKQFMLLARDHLQTPWQGHPRPEVTYLDPRGVFARAEMDAELVSAGH